MPELVLYGIRELASAIPRTWSSTLRWTSLEQINYLWSHRKLNNQQLQVFSLKVDGFYWIILNWYQEIRNLLWENAWLQNISSHCSYICGLLSDISWHINLACLAIIRETNHHKCSPVQLEIYFVQPPTRKLIKINKIKQQFNFWDEENPERELYLQWSFTINTYLHDIYVDQRSSQHILLSLIFDKASTAST